jgi:uncharacterized membrane protein
MKTLGLVGIINAFDTMAYQPAAMLEILGVAVLAPILLTLAIDLAFRKLKWIQKGDFLLKNDL